MKNNQHLTPFYTKMVEYTKKNVVQHDVPGHKLGQIPNEMLDFLGINTFKMDANAPRGLDNLNMPNGVIKEASDLMAEAFHADQAYFLTGGTTMGILAMVMSSCRAKEKIILPRNVHKSAINALILSGAIPIFVTPHIDEELGIANHIAYEDVLEAVNENPDAKAIFVINPTYFGVTSDLEKICKLAHDHDMMVLCDEAHGSHLHFDSELPLSAMDAGADLSAASLHKTAGSFTQSSVLFAQGERVDHVRLRSTINMLQSTSPSSLLLASLDVTRKTIYFEGPKRLPDVIRMAEKARNDINQIPGLSAVGKDHFIKRGAFGYDDTKLIVKVSDLGITGFDVYKEIFDTYNIQLELAETHMILAVLSIGTKQSDLDALVDALKKISDSYYPQHLKPIEPKIRYSYPEAFTRPREAYHAPKTYVKLADAEGEIAAESIMIYPPGIPIIIPGEIISSEILDDLEFYKKMGSVILSDTPKGYVKVIDKEIWMKWGEDDEF